MSRETVVEKAGRLLVTGSVRVRQVEGRTALVDVQGDHGRYQVERDHAGWQCGCPARGLCSHLHAASLVVALVSEAA